MSFVKDKAGVQPATRDLFDGERKGVFAVSGTVTNADAGTAVDIGVVPADADIVQVVVDVVTAFNGTGTDLLDVGNSTTADAYQADIDVSATGQTVTGYSNLGDVGSSDVTVQATYADANADSTAGEAQVTVLFIP